MQIMDKVLANITQGNEVFLRQLEDVANIV